MWTYDSVEYVTVAGEAWLASASEYPRSMRALWESRPWAATVLPCGRVFDVINLPGLFGRRVLDELWTSGPGCGPVATFRGRILVFAEPGTAARLRPLLVWEEWARDVPPLLCHGQGDAITVPPLQRPLDAPESQGRWIVAPDGPEPWLPGASTLLWACVRAARDMPNGMPRQTASEPTASTASTSSTAPVAPIARTGAAMTPASVQAQHGSAGPTPDVAPAG